MTAGPIAEINLQKTQEAMLAVVADPDNTTFSESPLENTQAMTDAASAAGGEPRVELLVQPERLWLDFIVRDNGPGISRAEQKKIFDPFYTSRNTNTNWGMGLYCARS